MKKITNKLKIILALLIFFNFQNLYATNTWFSKNKTYSGEIKFKGLKFQLLDGDWQVANKYDWHIMGIQSDGVTLVQVENNTIKAFNAGCDLVLHCNANYKEMSAVAIHSPLLSNFIIKKTSQFYKIIS